MACSWGTWHGKPRVVILWCHVSSCVYVCMCVRAFRFFICFCVSSLVFVEGKARRSWVLRERERVKSYSHIHISVCDSSWVFWDICKERSAASESERGLWERSCLWESTMDAVDSVFSPIKDFAKDSIRLVKRCHKPDRKGTYLSPSSSSSSFCCSVLRSLRFILSLT